MSEGKVRPSRRVLIARLSAAAATLGGLAALTSVARADASRPENTGSMSAAQDEWLDKPPALHRMLFDTTTSAGLAQALAFADVYFRVNKKSYGVAPDDLAVLIVMHHFSTPFGFDDVIWSKYGKPLSDKKYKQDLADPRTKKTPTLNVYNCKAIDNLANDGVTLDSLSAQGARFAVCDVATRGIADLLAPITHQSADALYAELTAHLIRNAVMVPAGVVAVNRAQERGYSYCLAT